MKSLEKLCNKQLDSLKRKQDKTSKFEFSNNKYCQKCKFLHDWNVSYNPNCILFGDYLWRSDGNMHVIKCYKCNH